MRYLEFPNKYPTPQREGPRSDRGSFKYCWSIVDPATPYQGQIQPLSVNAGDLCMLESTPSPHLDDCSRLGTVGTHKRQPWEPFVLDEVPDEFVCHLLINRHSPTVDRPYVFDAKTSQVCPFCAIPDAAVDSNTVGRAEKGLDVADRPPSIEELSARRPVQGCIRFSESWNFRHASPDKWVQTFAVAYPHRTLALMVRSGAVPEGPSRRS